MRTVAEHERDLAAAVAERDAAREAVEAARERERRAQAWVDAERHALTTARMAQGGAS